MAPLRSQHFYSIFYCCLTENFNTTIEKLDVLRSTSNLRGSDIFLNEDKCKADRAMQASLRQKVRELRNEGTEAKIKPDSIWIEKKEFKLEENKLIENV